MDATRSTAMPESGHLAQSRVEFDNEAFYARFGQAFSRCEVLTLEQARHFVEHGYVLIRNAFDPKVAESISRDAWRELEHGFGAMQDDPSTWTAVRSSNGHPGYLRTQGSGHHIKLRESAPLAFASQIDVIGGATRLTDGGRWLGWPDFVNVNLGVESTRPWVPPNPRQPGWHKDGWDFRHFLDSPEQGLLTVPIFSELLPRSGGTFIAADSVAPVARLLSAHPGGLHPDGLQGKGYLVPGLMKQCHRFVEITGQPGDMVLIHPFVLHRISPNPSTRPRMVANHTVILAEPMRFNRDEEDPYSLVELAVLHAMGCSSAPYVATGPRLHYTPPPHRSQVETERQEITLAAEMTRMAALGFVTPEWGTQLGYGSNRTMPVR